MPPVFEGHSKTQTHLTPSVAVSLVSFLSFVNPMVLNEGLLVLNSARNERFLLLDRALLDGDPLIPLLAREDIVCRSS